MSTETDHAVQVVQKRDIIATHVHSPNELPLSAAAGANGKLDERSMDDPVTLVAAVENCAIVVDIPIGIDPVPERKFGIIGYEPGERGAGLEIGYDGVFRSAFTVFAKFRSKGAIVSMRLELLFAEQHCASSPDVK